MPVTPPSLEDLFDDAKAEAIARRPELTFDEGDVSEFVIAGGAAMADHTLAYAAKSFRDQFLATSTGDALTDLADDRGVMRNEASSALGLVSFNRPTFAAGAGTIPAGTVVTTDTDSSGTRIQVQTTEDAAIGALAFDAFDVPCIALLSGPTGNIAQDTLTTISSTLFDASIVVNANNAFAGGNPAETDEALRERVRQLPNTIRRGTLAALEYGAKSVDGVSFAKAVEPTDAGFCNVYIADAAGGSSTPLRDAVQAEIVNWRAAGVVVNVIGASTVNVSPVTVALTVRSGIDVASLATNVKAAIAARTQRLKIGEAVTNAQILQAVLNVDSDNILDCAVTATLPVPAPNQLVRILTAAITVSVAS